MKKTLRFALLTAIVSAFSVGGVKAQTSTAKFDLTKVTVAEDNSVTLSSAPITIKLEGNTSVLKHNQSSNRGSRIYAGAKVTATADDGYLVTGIEFVANSKGNSVSTTGMGKVTITGQTNAWDAFKVGKATSYKWSDSDENFTTNSSNPIEFAFNGGAAISSGAGNVYVASINVTYKTTGAITTPCLNLDNTELNLEATAANSSVSGTFTLTGANLTAGTYNLTVPTVDGLSVNPTALTVGEDGTANQTFTVTYAPTANADEATANIGITVGDITKTVAVTYVSRVEGVKQRTISAATSWDFSQTGLSGNAASTAVDNLTLYSDLGATISTAFPADAMLYQGPIPTNNGKSARIGTLQFKTSVPGNITVKFSDTGSSVSPTATPRFLVVNGTQTEYYTCRPTSGTKKSNDTKTTGNIFVPAGDVTISSTQNVEVYSVTFTPVELTEAGTVTIKANFQRTSFSSDKAIDFSKTEGLTAYVVTDATGKVAAVTSVPANTGVIVERAAATAEAQTFTLYEATDAVAPAANLLSAASALTTTDGASIYGYGRKNGVEGFYLYKSGLTPTAGKAYLVLPQSSEAKEFISFGGNNGQTDAINAVIAEQNAENANIYNLAGQQVNKAYKGVVVVNGKKYIQK